MTSNSNLYSMHAVVYHVDTVLSNLFLQKYCCVDCLHYIYIYIYYITYIWHNRMHTIKIGLYFKCLCFSVITIWDLATIYNFPITTWLLFQTWPQIIISLMTFVQPFLNMVIHMYTLRCSKALVLEVCNAFLSLVHLQPTKIVSLITALLQCKWKKGVHASACM
jgi:hypothetical protein